VSGDDKVLFDRLAKSLRGLSPGRMEQVLRKSETVQIRLTAAEKGGMKRMAKRYRLSLTDYLTRLHALAEEIARKAEK
jgi:hypothetical protein